MTDNMSAGRDSFPLDSFDIEKWSVQVEYVASAVSNKEEELTEAELDNFGTLLQKLVKSQSWSKVILITFLYLPVTCNSKRSFVANLQADGHG
jgi:hypothetical protein